eukprot:m.619748 g.619748  ORF g.619748 m.619748 type:complete len:103 (+) comp22530_c0_seq46:3418-3726(+)
MSRCDDVSTFNRHRYLPWQICDAIDPDSEQSREDIFVIESNEIECVYGKNHVGHSRLQLCSGIAALPVTPSRGNTVSVRSHGAHVVTMHKWDVTGSPTPLLS